MPAIVPTRAVFAAAVALAVALLGTFTHIVHQATDAGAKRYLTPANTAIVAKADARAGSKAAPRR